MSATRCTVRGFSNFGRRGLQNIQGNSIQLPAKPSRASLLTRAFTLSPPSRISSHASRQVVGRSVRSPIPSWEKRTFSATSASLHGHWEPPKPGEEIWVTFVDKDGDEHKIAVNKGDNLLTIAQGNDIEMEGACEGSCSCSTCHVIVEDEDMFDKIPEATDDENDMLDLAFGLTETSRLGCQIEMTKELDGLRVKLPSMTRNLQASDFSKK
ncbi:related to mitochondrial ferredoxin [Phialocephala subalpina]|uniref:Related to mitochondrial ferredoxin n=1 Tax=Phialocephala subalpina TaxID=576137 RepID=A0A1L7WUS2_9HELO|nr:related to mitochondrial ferredoxin [Phialocephala subalpina]